MADGDMRFFLGRAFFCSPQKTQLDTPHGRALELVRPLYMTLFEKLALALRYVVDRNPPGLDDEAFYRLHYENSGIPRGIPGKLRRIFVRSLGGRWRSMVPSDRPTDLCDDLDFADLIDEVAEEFGIVIPKADMHRMDGSFDGIVRYLAARSKREGDD
jgi:hypothetical protein